MEEEKVIVDPLCKVFVSRIPSKFTEASLLRILEAQVGSGSVVNVGLKYKEDEELKHLYE